MTGGSDERLAFVESMVDGTPRDFDDLGTVVNEVINYSDWLILGRKRWLAFANIEVPKA